MRGMGADSESLVKLHSLLPLLPLSINSSLSPRRSSEMSPLLREWSFYPGTAEGRCRHRA
jgi:hypothetical protein